MIVKAVREPASVPLLVMIPSPRSPCSTAGNSTAVRSLTVINTIMRMRGEEQLPEKSFYASDLTPTASWSAGDAAHV